MAKYLTAQKAFAYNGITVKQYLASSRPVCKLTTANGKPAYITIHNTATIKTASDTTMAEQYSRATVNGNMGDVWVHYYIDHKECWNILEDTRHGWHAADGATGKGNCQSLAIEIIMDGTKSTASQQAEDRGAKLAAYLLYTYGLSIDRLKTHKDWYTKKYCPAYILGHWATFKATVEKYRKALEDAEKAKTAAKNSGKVQTTAKKTTYKVQCGAFSKKSNAETLEKKITAKGFEAAVVYSKPYYKVQCGAFSKRENATALVEKLSKSGFVATIITITT